MKIVKCKDCKGTGEIEIQDKIYITCKKCAGMGKIKLIKV
jgi:DnaJ-class molecular chaperone